MKIYTSLLVFMALLAFGCSEQVDINSPENLLDNPTTSFSKVDDVDWIGLPTSMKTLHKGAMFSDSEKIDGGKGGELEIKADCEGGPFGKIKIEAKLNFPKGAFKGKKTITMSLEQSFGSTIFSPHSTFKKAAEYNLKYEGLDLKGLRQSNLDFVYLSEDGTYEKVKYDDIKMDLSKGKIEIKNAKLPHFSRYGFIRKANGN
jgi:hypothetical protein